MTRWGGPPVYETEHGVDFDARYTVAGHSGVAWWLHGWATEQTPEQWVLFCTSTSPEHEHGDECYLYDEPETVPDYGRVRAVMVGDDREEIVDVDDLIPLPDDGFCADCGQTGCQSNVYN